MTAIAGLAREVETAAYRSWPARQLEEYDNWQLRYADGFSRRGNSLYPAGSSALDYETKLHYCRDWFRDRGLDLVVRQTPASEAGVDELLAERGFSLEGETDVMVAELPAFAPRVSPLLAPQPSTRWWDAMASMWRIGLSRQSGWRGIIERIDLPAAYGLQIDGQEDIAAGLAVVDGSWVGLFEVVVAEERRRHGIGADFTRSLLAWGRSQGADRAYLQVVKENEAAIALYETLGFGHAYTYWYRRAPGG